MRSDKVVFDVTLRKHDDDWRLTLRIIADPVRETTMVFRTKPEAEAARADFLLMMEQIGTLEQGTLQ